MDLESILQLAVMVAAVSGATAMLWSLAYALGRARGEYGPALRKCEIRTCNMPARADTDRCEWHTATMSEHAARNKLRRRGYQIADADDLTPNRRKPRPAA